VGIHPLAVVHPTARLGQDCEVGPFCVIEQDVVLGDRCVLESHAVIRRGVTLGNDNRIFESSVIGGLPQHVQVRTYDGGLRVGNNNVFREYTTLHRSMTPGTSTVIGDNCFFMVNAHVAHDCIVGNNVIIANNSMLGGHVTVDDRAFISGGVAVHQFCRVGRQCMVGGTARVVKDVPPYVTIDGVSTFVVGLNTVGLRRGGMTSQDMVQLKAAYRTIYRSGYSWREVLEHLAAEFATGPAAEFHKFLLGTKRGIVAERRLPPGATIKLSVTEEADDSGETSRRAGAG
jgi:UDP-N-acetylglucosamine acyltransferase